MKKKQREKFLCGVAVGVAAFSSVAAASAISFLALKKLQRFIQLTADTSIDSKLYERDWEELLNELEDKECEEYEVCFYCKD
ncbi:hypothetical protein AAA081_06185 [Aedoeadaptatus acetigenes]|uniref:Uncharacterized protein n=1 Tax=Aedoeadaptatus acetigenes TaxID=2981723 RepID=A0ABV1J6Q0_9FIRM